MKSTRRILLLKHTLYAVILYLLYIIQTMPNLFVIAGNKPVWVVPFVVAVAMFEGEFVGGIYGAVAGLLCDFGGFTLFGFNGAICCLCCIASGLMVIYLMRRNVFCCMLFVFITMMLRGSIGYFFAYGIWDYDNSWKVFIFQMIPTSVYTVLATPFVYAIFSRIYRRFVNIL